MYRVSVALVIIICLVVGSCTPYTIQLIEPQDIIENPDLQVVAVITKAGEYLEFEPDAVLKDSLIVGYVSDGPSKSVALANVDSIYVRRESHLDYARHLDSIEGSRLEEQSKRDRLRAAGCILGAATVIGLYFAIVAWVESWGIGQP
jgi:hypothetical protein